MTTRVAIINFGPLAVKVKTHSGCACGNNTYTGSECIVQPHDIVKDLLFVHSGQRVIITEIPPQDTK